MVSHDLCMTAKFKRVKPLPSQITCEECGELHNIKDLDFFKNKIICKECKEKLYVTCSVCGLTIPRSDAMIDSDTEVEYCSSCFRHSKPTIVGYHSHKNKIKFFGDTQNNTMPYLGVELEVESDDECSEIEEMDDDALSFRNKFDKNFVYFETDGSLEAGFEIITQPTTLKHHISLKDSYSQGFSDLVSSGYRSHDSGSCGLHVHFNKDFYSDNEDLYTTHLLYIMEKFWDNLVKFSRRRYGSINDWAKKYEEEPTKVIEKSKKGELGRYYALNLTNKNTIEFRIFRGTLNINTFIATLELVNAMILLAKNIENVSALQATTWEDLLVTDRLKSYWETVKNR